MTGFISMCILSYHSCNIESCTGISGQLRGHWKHRIQLGNKSILSSHFFDQSGDILRNKPTPLPRIPLYIARTLKSRSRIKRRYPWTIHIATSHQTGLRINVVFPIFSSFCISISYIFLIQILCHLHDQPVIICKLYTLRDRSSATIGRYIT